MSGEAKRYLRFLVSDRVLHFLLLISFTMLAITGLVQKYSDAGISVAIIQALGGIAQTRVIHHAFAVILIMTSIAHAVQVGYRLYVQRKAMSMLPTLGDVTDFVAAINRAARSGDVGGAPQGEQLRNGDFARWPLAGDRVGAPQRVPGIDIATTFSIPAPGEWCYCV